MRRDLFEALDREQRFDYVYAYSPRQAYRPFGPEVDAEMAARRLWVVHRTC
ncbi:hypothetical protein ACIBHX_46025 [Nonomuraea sp. NPDC050536]|uniref:hypothetical protein n=1 Tax=Nonomuraea sp. NPDC050536 TaxID=3364366 RepID=UPI0037CC3609